MNSNKWDGNVKSRREIESPSRSEKHNRSVNQWFTNYLGTAHAKRQVGCRR